MALTDIGSGVLYEGSTTGSGTGNYNSFVRINATDTETGFNTDVNNQDDNKNGPWTHSLKVSSLDTVTIGSDSYYVIRLDLNEIQSGTSPNITLEDLQLFRSAAPAVDDSFAGMTQVFDLGTALNLVDTNHGSGTDDYVFYIPTSLFPDPNQYFTLYAEFSGSDDGFEEFRALTSDTILPSIHLEKTASVTAIDEGTPTDITYTYVVTNTSSDPSERLMLTTLIDDNGTPSDSSDDFDVLAVGTFVGGDTDGDGFLDTDETWTYTYTREDVVVNAGNLTNTAGVNGIDENGNNATDDDTATVTVNDVAPHVGLVKTVSPTQVQAGTPTDVTFTYEVTNTGLSTDPLHLTTLIDDNGTVGTGDDFDVLLVGTFLGGDTDGDGLVDTDETWVYTYTESVTVGLGETRTNIAVVHATDDEGNDTSAQDDASITSYNLGRTPGFWSNNGAKLWDGNDGTWPKGGDLGIVSIKNPGSDIAYAIYDLNGDGTSDSSGNRGYLMIGDWNLNGIADANENVLVISRNDALTLLNSSLKQQQDGRFQVGRDVVASWLNYLGGSYVGASDDPNSPMHYIDEATAWLIQTTTDHNHVLTVSELSSAKVLQSSSAWGQGFDFDGDSIKGENQTPTPPSHDIGLGTTLDIMAGSVIHSGLDHYNNFGFV